ncbi:hypothetical protein, partial [Escherichia coli]|uniref:hypothetical protein n=1 Tax=Escherichia coli TaxID=562 RepID=UPI001BC863CE
YSATNRAVGGSNPPGCTIFSEIFSNEGIEEVAELTAGTRDDNVALARPEGRAAASNPPGCTIFSQKFPSKISHF